jgi:hypothetical protein
LPPSLTEHVAFCSSVMLMWPAVGVRGPTVAFSLSTVTNRSGLGRGGVPHDAMLARRECGIGIRDCWR